MFQKVTPLKYDTTDYAYTYPINWDQIFRDINRTGICNARLCQLIGKRYSSLQRWLEGTEPKEHVARAILTIHARYCGENLTRQRIEESYKYAGAVEIHRKQLYSESNG